MDNRLTRSNPSDIRRESDSLGTVAVPASAYYGVQTMRAITNFQISGIPIGHYPLFIKAFACVKKAAAVANYQLSDLPDEKMKAITLACDDIAAGRMNDQFTVDVFQGGAGTSTNMNVNEVIANRGLEIMGFPPATCTAFASERRRQPFPVYQRRVPDSCSPCPSVRHTRTHQCAWSVGRCV